MPRGWHALSLSAVISALKTHDAEGLSSKEASRRLAAGGPNKLAARKPPGVLNIFLSQFEDPMVLTLLLAVAISALMRETLDAVVIGLIVALNAVLGAVQEMKAEASLEALESYAPDKTQVIREGRVEEIDTHEVVRGDLLVLRPGVRVAADARLLPPTVLRVEQAALTGESAPSGKDASFPAESETPLLDRRNMVYGGTLVTRGEGLALVVSTGMNTEMGKIAQMVSLARRQTTPLEMRLRKLGRSILLISVGTCAGLVVLGVTRGLPFHEMFLTGVSLAVAAVPEGLPAVVTLSFALGVQRMAKQGAIVRKLEAIETLGSVTAICTDKTGTVTKNLMEVVEVAVSPIVGSPHPRAATAASRSLLLFALLASDAREAPGKRGGGSGDPTEQAIVQKAIDWGIEVESLDEIYPRLAEQAFTPERRMMSVRASFCSGDIIFAKGAPDTIIPLCSHYAENGGSVYLSQERRQAWISWVESKAADGMRVLAVAVRTVSEGAEPAQSYSEEGLTLHGCLVMADPVRDEVRGAVEECRKAGISTILITGDHLRTAESIALQAGILQRGESGLTGEDIGRMSENRLAKALETCRAFARVSPAHKLSIVKALKKSGHVVAMTGDGVNDAPALKEAAVGVAMGETGTDVAREASSIVLLDDNFSTIVKAVAEGRAIYDSVTRFIRYLFSCNLGEVITMAGAAIFGFPMPLRPTHILWMNLVTDGFPALALALSATDEDLMSRPPRNPREGLFSRGLFKGIAARGVYIGAATLIVFLHGLSTSGLERAQTLAYATLVTVQLVAAFDCCPEASGRNLLMACLFSWLLLFVTVQWKPLSPVFRTVPLSFGDWAIVFLASVFPDLMRGAVSRSEH